MSQDLAEALTAPPVLLAPLAAGSLSADQAAGLDLILEGFLHHHGRPRLVDPASGPVLTGDACYAGGLVLVAASGDLTIIGLLAGLISRSATLVAEGQVEHLPALWAATVAAIGHPDPETVERVRIAEIALSTGDASAMHEIAAGIDILPELTEVLSP
jgi:hypothetical protein